MPRRWPGHPAYLDVEDFHEAEHIVKQMEKHLHANKKKDFTPEETAELRHHYTEALRKRGPGLSGAVIFFFSTIFSKIGM